MKYIIQKTELDRILEGKRITLRVKKVENFFSKKKKKKKVENRL